MNGESVTINSLLKLNSLFFFVLKERAESQLVEEKTSELKNELELVTAQVEELREARRRQETMVSQST
jgi:hypothetical protein